MSSDNHYVIDFHPSDRDVLLAGCMSGTGYKVRERISLEKEECPDQKNVPDPHLKNSLCAASFASLQHTNGSSEHAFSIQISNNTLVRSHGLKGLKHSERPVEEKPNDFHANFNIVTMKLITIIY